MGNAQRAPRHSVIEKTCPPRSSNSRGTAGQKDAMTHEGDDSTEREREIARLAAAQSREQARDRRGVVQRRRAEVALDAERLAAGAEASPPAVIPNKKDAPSDYDAELGRLVEETRQESPPPEGAEEQWIRMCTDLASLMVQTSRYHEHVQMPVARLPEPTSRPRIHPRVLVALPELAALHRRLLPGWEDIAKGWLESCARAREEATYRKAWARKAKEAKEAKEGKQYNQMENRVVTPAAQLRLTLVAQGAPETLTVEMLNILGGLVTRKVGRGRVITVETAGKNLNEWARDPGAFFAAMEQLKEEREQRKAKRKARQQEEQSEPADE